MCTPGGVGTFVGLAFGWPDDGVVGAGPVGDGAELGHGQGAGSGVGVVPVSAARWDAFVDAVKAGALDR